MEQTTIFRTQELFFLSFSLHQIIWFFSRFFSLFFAGFTRANQLLLFLLAKVCQCLLLLLSLVENKKSRVSEKNVKRLTSGQQQQHKQREKKHRMLCVWSRELILQISRTKINSQSVFALLVCVCLMCIQHNSTDSY